MTAHHGTTMLYVSYVHLNLFPETLLEPINYQTEVENPYVLFGGRILNIDAVIEARLLENMRAHRVPEGICAGDGAASVFQGTSNLMREKAEIFQSARQLADNFEDFSFKFRKIVEKMEGRCYNEEK